MSRPESKAADPPMQGGPQAEERARILIIDDQPDGQAALAAALESLPAEVVRTGSGEEALGLLLKGEFACVLLDVRMPGMDGFETARLIRSRESTRRLPILFVTGYDLTPEQIAQVYELGAVDFVTKPVESLVLRAKVNVFVELYRHVKAAEQSRVRYGTLSRLAPVGFFHTDSQGECLWVNLRWCEISGLTPEEARGKGWRMAVHPEDRQRVADEWAEAVRDRRVFRSEYRFRHHDGRITWVLGQASSEEDTDGRTLGYIGTITDITDRKEAEDKLQRAQAELERRVEDRTRDLKRELADRGKAEEAARAAQAQLRLVMDHAPALISYVDREGRYVYANRTYEDWFGHSPESVRGRHLRDVVGPTAFEKIRPHVEAALAGRPVTYEDDLPYLSGTRSIRAAYVPDFGPAGEVVGFVALVTDITDRKRREERERFLSEASAALSSSLDYEATIRQVSELAIRKLADWCAVDLLQGGEIRRFAVMHRDPAKARWAQEMQQRYPVDPKRTFGAPQVLRTGKAELYAEVTDDLLRASARDEDHLKALREAGITSAMIVPMPAAGRILGALSLVSTRPGWKYGPEDLALAEELGRRAALAVENADLYREAEREIDRRERVEHELREAEERLRLVLEGALDAVVTMDQEGRIVAWNAQAENVFGWSRSEVVGRTLEETLVPERHREAHHQGLKRYLSTGEGRIFGKRLELTALRKGSDEFPVELTVIPVQVGGKAYFTAFLRDISERKNAEESAALLSALVHGSQDAIITSALDGRITSWNEGAERVFGYSAAEMIGQPIAKLIPRERMGEERPILERLSRGEGVEPYQTVRRRKDGTLIHMLLTVSPLRSRDGAIVGASKIARDISERVRAEEAIVRLNESLEERVKARTAELEQTLDELNAFSYTVAHDLRTPLRAMTRFSDILLQDHASKLDAEGGDFLRRIAAAATRMDVMIRDLLAYSKVTRAETRIGLVPVEEVLEEVLRQLSDEVARQKARIEIRRPLPSVSADRVLLSQALNNLIGNALKFVPKGEAPEIVVRSERHDERWRIWIEDRGIGIAPVYVDRLFKMFERLHGADEFPGTGIGLAIVRRAVERMHGRVGFEPRPGGGTRFWIDLSPGGIP